MNQNDFIDLEFTGKAKDGAIFDTNIKDEAKKLGLELDSRPVIICLGQNMILPAIDKFLIGKEPGKYTLELAPENAFGNRNREMIKTMPAKIFLEKNIMPQQGMVFNFDNILGKISAVSGGRVIVDFNNPLAGKFVVYNLDVKRVVTDLNEKINSLMDFFFRKRLEFSVEGAKLNIKCEKNFIQLVSFFKEKFKEALNLDLEVSESQPAVKPSEKPEEKKN